MGQRVQADSENAAESDRGEKQELILEAATTVLGRGGIGALSMRAVAAEAGVALGLINYHFDDKTSLIVAALERIGRADARLVRPTDGLEPVEQLRGALRRVADEEFLRSDYLALRLQLWSLAPVDPSFAAVNHEAQVRYREGLARLVGAARPGLDADEVARRAADILIIQNGMWLTSILIVDQDAIERSIARCEQIALG